MLGLRYDRGDASTYGMALYLASEARGRRDGLGAMAWYGAGLALDLVTKSHDAIDGVVVSVPCRLDFVGHVVGFFGLEARAGMALNEPQLVGSVGAFLGFYYFDVGYSYQFPLGPFDRPDGMASHQLSVRLQVPLFRWNVREP